MFSAYLNSIQICLVRFNFTTVNQLCGLLQPPLSNISRWNETRFELKRIIRSFEAWSHHEMSLYHLRSTKSTFARFHSAMISSSCKREFLMLTWNLKAKQRQHAVSEGTWNPACLGQMASSIFSVSSLKVSAGLLEDFSFFGLNLRDALVLSLYEFFAIIPALVD